MLFYVIGSLLFVFGMIFAVGVIAANLAHYRVQMVAALRTLSMDSVHDQHRSMIHSGPSGLALKQGQVRRALRPAA